MKWNNRAVKWVGLWTLTMGIGSFGSPCAEAMKISPVSYDMPNGHGQASSGMFNYWDLAYTGSGDTMSDGAALTGGLGDLTDGVAAGDNWFNTENVAGTGPYVGWANLDPVITFHFDEPRQWQTIRIHVDDADGAGGVSTPSAVTVGIGPASEAFPIADPAGDAPFWIELDVSNLGAAENQVEIELTANNIWVFASEVEFIAVPEPATAGLLTVMSSLLALRPTRKR